MLLLPAAFSHSCIRSLPGKITLPVQVTATHPCHGPAHRASCLPNCSSQVELENKKFLQAMHFPHSGKIMATQPTCWRQTAVSRMGEAPAAALPMAGWPRQQRQVSHHAHCSGTQGFGVVPTERRLLLQQQHHFKHLITKSSNGTQDMPQELRKRKKKEKKAGGGRGVRIVCFFLMQAYLDLTETLGLSYRDWFASLFSSNSHQSARYFM